MIPLIEALYGRSHGFRYYMRDGGLIKVCALLITAYAYSDLEKVDARDLMDELSTRSSSVDVPFQRSLREFLEGAVSAHRRALDSDYGADLEARTVFQVEVWQGNRNPPWRGNVDSGTTAFMILLKANAFFHTSARTLRRKEDGSPVQPMTAPLAQLFPHQQWAHFVLP
ncbi:hypothetical protein DFP72DRAFT_1062714 [Ephemerocybe angulata]|uniref:Uncharacterized protein n=1 Tax=Ephemerocybe angulata TaxID=980116 RepID=A0A8H6MEG8_9AGAR|nr:hypothetical protein DFP72DRAFT_1062714 [Tulosesus angulatus]